MLQFIVLNYRNPSIGIILCRKVIDHTIPFRRVICITSYINAPCPTSSTACLSRCVIIYGTSINNFICTFSLPECAVNSFVEPTIFRTPLYRASSFFLKTSDICACRMSPSPTVNISKAGNNFCRIRRCRSSRITSYINAPCTTSTATCLSREII